MMTNISTVKTAGWTDRFWTELNRIRNDALYQLLLRGTLFFSSHKNSAAVAVFDVSQIAKNHLLDRDGHPVIGAMELTAGLILLSRIETLPSARQRTTDGPNWIPPTSRLTQLLFFATGMYGPLLPLYGPSLQRSVRSNKGRLSWLSGWADFGRKSLDCRCLWLVSALKDCPNCTYWTKKALKEMTGIKDDDIVHLSLRNDVYQIPFCVAYDHANRSVMILLRGSGSAFDVLLDVAAEPYPLSASNGKGWTGHKGMVQAAEALYAELGRNGALWTAFQFHPDYKLIDRKSVV